MYLIRIKLKLCVFFLSVGLKVCNPEWRHSEHEQDPCWYIIIPVIKSNVPDFAAADLYTTSCCKTSLGK